MLLQFFQIFTLFLCCEIITQTYVVIVTINSMFCHNMQCPLYCSNFPELKQSEQSSYSRCLCLSLSPIFTSSVYNIKKAGVFFVFCKSVFRETAKGVTSGSQFYRRKSLSWQTWWQSQISANSNRHQNGNRFECLLQTHDILAFFLWPSSNVQRNYCELLMNFLRMSHELLKNLLQTYFECLMTFFQMSKEILANVLWISYKCLMGF